MNRLDSKALKRFSFALLENSGVAFLYLILN